MKRTISVEIGKGSLNHNSRKFKAVNVDAERSKNNISYCHEDIKQVYHDLFDDALARYNARQSRTDRKIEDYYEKIRMSKQEKLFHEMIIQIGNVDDMSATGENAELAKKILNEYYEGFQERNPYLRVFSAHLHMDEATPHLHIDFVPFTTDSKRGLDTRVSLKQALANQGFAGGNRGNTEWNQWVLSEKKHLAEIMKWHGIEWEQKGTHEKHLSVLDFKKQERTKEIALLEDRIIDKQDEFRMYENRIKNYETGEQIIQGVSERLDTDKDFQLPDPSGLMSAKSYKTKFADPVIKNFKGVIREALSRYYRAVDDYKELNVTTGRLYNDNVSLRQVNEKLFAENMKLKKENKEYKSLQNVLGKEQVDEICRQARNSKAKKRDYLHLR